MLNCFHSSSQLSCASLISLLRAAKSSSRTLNPFNPPFASPNRKPLASTISTMSKFTDKTFTLNTGDKIPAIGLGTWQSAPDDVTKAVEAALRFGYRYIDTAAAYYNEKEVGDGIKKSGIARSDIWLTTKLNNIDHERVAEALDESLRKLGTDYIDLYLIHWPCATDPTDSNKQLPNWDYIKTWREMQKLVGTGKVRNIGVSNFGITHLDALFADPEFKICPAVNQIELHPCNPSPKLVAYSKSKGIELTGYSCLGSTNSPLYKNEALLKVAKAKGRTPQQVLLKWGVNKGWNVIPKSVTEERIQANFDLNDWSLTDDEMATIDAISDRFKVCGDSWLPSGVRVFFGDDE